MQKLWIINTLQRLCCPRSGKIWAQSCFDPSNAWSLCPNDCNDYYGVSALIIAMLMFVISSHLSSFATTSNHNLLRKHPIVTANDLVHHNHQHHQHLPCSTPWLPPWQVVPVEAQESAFRTSTWQEKSETKWKI